MTELPHWALWIAAVVNAGSAAWCITAALRHPRETREIRKAAEFMAIEIQRVAALDHLLMQLCCQAFSRDTHPMWQAWAETMGNIELNIRGSFRGRDWSADLAVGNQDETSAEASE